MSRYLKRWTDRACKEASELIDPAVGQEEGRGGQGIELGRNKRKAAGLKCSHGEEERQLPALTSFGKNYLGKKFLGGRKGLDGKSQ